MYNGTRAQNILENLGTNTIFNEHPVQGVEEKLCLLVIGRMKKYMALIQVLNVFCLYLETQFEMQEGISAPCAPSLPPLDALLSRSTYI